MFSIRFINLYACGCLSDVSMMAWMNLDLDADLCLCKAVTLTKKSCLIFGAEM